MKNKSSKIGSARLSDNFFFEYHVFKLLFMFIYFSGVKLCKFNALHNPSSSQHYDRYHYNLRCIIEYKHFTR